MSAPVVQLPPGCKIVEAPSAPQTAAMFEGYPDLLTPDDMAEIIRQSAKTVRKLMKVGRDSQRLQDRGVLVRGEGRLRRVRGEGQA